MSEEILLSEVNIHPNKNNLDKNKEVLLLIFFSTVLIVISNLYFFRKNVPSLITDEFGYLANAAYFVGIDWREMLSSGPSYLYGYSIILIPLFLLSKNPTSLYQSIMILNTVLLTLSFLLLYNINKKIFKPNKNNIKKPLLMLISLFSVIANSSIVKVDSVMSEMLLMFLFLVIVNLVYRIIEIPKKTDFILLSFTLVYIYSTHNRMIGLIVAVYVLIIFLLINKKIEKNNVLFFSIFLLFFFLANNLLSNYLTGTIYKYSKLTSLHGYSAQFNKLKAIFTAKGFLSFINLLTGQLYYLSFSTILTGLAALFVLTRKVFGMTFSSFKKVFSKEKIGSFFETEDYIKVFIWLSTISIILIGVIFLASGPIRLDHLVYGRYYEPILPLLISIGTVEIIKNNINSKKYLILILLMCVLTIVTNNFVSNFDSDRFSTINAQALYIFYEDFLEIYLPGMLSMLVGILTFLLIDKNNNIVNFLSVLLLSVYSFVLLSHNNNIGITVVLDKDNIGNADILESVRNDESIEKVFLYGNNFIISDFIDQYLLFEKSINFISTSKNNALANIEPNHFLISRTLSREILENYKLEKFNNFKCYLFPEKNPSKSFTIDGKSLVSYNPFNFRDDEYPINTDFEIEYNNLNINDVDLDNQTLQIFNGLGSSFEKGSYKLKHKLKVNSYTKNSQFSITLFKAGPSENDYGETIHESTINIDEHKSEIITDGKYDYIEIENTITLNNRVNDLRIVVTVLGPKTNLEYDNLTISVE